MIRYEVRDHVAEILFDQPPVNALTETLLDAYLAALKQADDDPTVRAIILGSAVPGRFCVGLNLLAIHQGDHAQVQRLLERLYVQHVDVQFQLRKSVS